MAVGDIFEVAAVCRHPSGQNMINVTHWKITDLVGITPTLQEIADYLSGLQSTALLPLLPKDTAYRGAKVRRIFPDATQVAVTTEGSGTSASLDPSIPAQCCPLLSIRASAAPPPSPRPYVPPGLW